MSLKAYLMNYQNNFLPTDKKCSTGQADMGIHNVCDRLNLIYDEVAHVDVNSILGVEQASI